MIWTSCLTRKIWRNSVFGRKSSGRFLHGQPLKFANSCWETEKRWQTRAFTRQARVKPQHTLKLQHGRLSAVKKPKNYPLAVKSQNINGADETSHRSGQFWISSMNWKVARSSSRPSAILLCVTQITGIVCLFWLVDNHQHTFANFSHVKYEFTNTKKLARLEASSICRQQFANVFADCFCAVHTHQLEFAKASLQT